MIWDREAREEEREGIARKLRTVGADASWGRNRSAKWRSTTLGEGASRRTYSPFRASKLLWQFLNCEDCSYVLVLSFLSELCIRCISCVYFPIAPFLHSSCCSQSAKAASKPMGPGISNVAQKFCIIGEFRASGASQSALGKPVVAESSIKHLPHGSCSWHDQWQHY